jgi:cytochrome c553
MATAATRLHAPCAMASRGKAAPMLHIRDWRVWTASTLFDSSMHLRKAETMHPIAKALSAEERQAVAKFYAGLTAPAIAEPNKADDNIIAIGATLANRGDWPKGLPGCGQCHGAAGQGVGETFPKLAGQSAEYIANQLKAWKDGKRSNDPLHLMTGISSKLNDRQVAAVAAYYASLPAIPTTPQGSKP